MAHLPSRLLSSCMFGLHNPCWDPWSFATAAPETWPSQPWPKMQPCQRSTRFSLPHVNHINHMLSIHCFFSLFVSAGCFEFFLHHFDLKFDFRFHISLPKQIPLNNSTRFKKGESPIPVDLLFVTRSCSSCHFPQKECSHWNQHTHIYNIYCIFSAICSLALNSNSWTETGCWTSRRLDLILQLYLAIASPF